MRRLPSIPRVLARPGRPVVGPSPASAGVLDGVFDRRRLLTASAAWALVQAACGPRPRGGALHGDAAVPPPITLMPRGGYPHDLGGMRLGPVPGIGAYHEHPARDAVAWAILIAILANDLLTGSWHIRHTVERIRPADYLRFRGYDGWVAAFEAAFAEAGVVTRAAVAARIALLRAHPGFVPRLTAARTATIRRHLEEFYRAFFSIDDDGSTLFPGPERARFAPGDAVVARRGPFPSHNRLPRYVRGHRGVVEAVGPEAVIPSDLDANLNRKYEKNEALYRVRFAGQELWGPSAEPRTSVTLELWESYLEPAG